MESITLLLTFLTLASCGPLEKRQIAYPVPHSLPVPVNMPPPMFLLMQEINSPQLQTRGQFDEQQQQVADHSAFEQSTSLHSGGNAGIVTGEHHVVQENLPTDTAVSNGDVAPEQVPVREDSQVHESSSTTTTVPSTVSTTPMMLENINSGSSRNGFPSFQEHQQQQMMMNQNLFHQLSQQLGQHNFPILVPLNPNGSPMGVMTSSFLAPKPASRQFNIPTTTTVAPNSSIQQVREVIRSGVKGGSGFGHGTRSAFYQHGTLSQTNDQSMQQQKNF